MACPGDGGGGGRRLREKGSEGRCPHVNMVNKHGICWQPFSPRLSFGAWPRASKHKFISFFFFFFKSGFVFLSVRNPGHVFLVLFTPHERKPCLGGGKDARPASGGHYLDACEGPASCCVWTPATANLRASDLSLHSKPFSGLSAALLHQFLLFRCHSDWPTWEPWPSQSLS